MFYLLAVNWTIWKLAGAIVGGFFGLLILLLALSYGGLWFQARFSGAPVSVASLIGMSLRKVNARTIVVSRIMAIRAGLDLSAEELESHYLAGGRVTNVVRALIAADRANIKLTFKTATAIDLAGRDILDAVQTSVNPKVIDCPDPSKGKETVDAVAQDGIQLRAKARVTVRANIDRLIGGATEETIIARVGEGIVTTIGGSINHKSVLEAPDRISKSVLEKGLDAGTAFEILSIDIADVDVGENIGAQLQKAQALADQARAVAEAEKRRAMAIARQEEMRALVHENRAKVVLAEAEIPKAMAEAFRSGNFGIMDYYRMKNVMADTSMPDSIAGMGKDKEKEKGS